MLSDRWSIASITTETSSNASTFFLLRLLNHWLSFATASEPEMAGSGRSSRPVARGFSATQQTLVKREVAGKPRDHPALSAVNMILKSRVHHYSFPSFSNCPWDLGIHSRSWRSISESGRFSHCQVCGQPVTLCDLTLGAITSIDRNIPKTLAQILGTAVTLDWLSLGITGPS